MASNAVCLINSHALSIVNEEVLRNAGFKTVPAANLLPDLVFSRAGSSVAVLLLNVEPIDSERITRMQQAFKHSCILAPRCHQLSLTDLIVSENAPTIIFTPEDARITRMTEEAVSAAGIWLNDDNLDAAHAQREAVVQSDEFQQTLFESLPVSPSLTPSHASALRDAFGSIANLSDYSADEIVYSTEGIIDQTTARRIAAALQATSWAPVESTPAM